MTKRAILYARVSSDDTSKDGRNLAGQLDMCREYAERQGWQVVAELAEDERGVSGARMDAPQLNCALDMARAGDFDILIARELDRLARGLAKQLIVEEEFRRHGVTLDYVLGDYADTPEGNLMKNVRAVVAEYERLKIVERSTRGRRQKAQQGQWPGDGHAGYGYRKLGKGKEARLAIDETEAAIVRRIFKLYIGENGKPLPLQTIAAVLTAEGVPPPNRGGGTAHPGSGWHRATIRRLIQHSRFIGEFHYGDLLVPLPELAIVDRATFEAAQARRDISRAASINVRKYDFLLSGHLRCTCGLRMAGNPQQGGRYLYYECGRLSNARHLSPCREPSVRADVVDPLVWGWIHACLLDTEELERGLKRLDEQRECDTQPQQERLALIDDLIAKAERKVKRLAAAFAAESDDIIATAYQAEMKTAAREREVLAIERQELVTMMTAGRLSVSDRQMVLRAAEDIRHKLGTLSFEQKRVLLNLLDVRVELTRQGDDRCLKVTCGMKLTPDGKPEQTSLRLSSLGQKFSSTTTTSPPSTSSSSPCSASSI